jgi:DNA-directed RNA polymerase subunit RPC12/RpoP
MDMNDKEYPERIRRNGFDPFWPSPIPKKLDYHCIGCGNDVEGMVRIQNNRLNYVRCLSCGIGVKKKRGTP